MDINEDALDGLKVDQNCKIPVNESIMKGAYIQGIQQYQKMYQESIENTSGFWDKIAKDSIKWFHPYENVCSIDLPPKSSGSKTIPEDGNVYWFEGGKLNACYNAVDRHVNAGRADKVAILHEGNEPGNCQRITYKQLLARVSEFANGLKQLSVQKGDIVTIYMPMIPEAAYAILACARIGAISNVVFAGFSSESLASRIMDAKSRLVITANQGRRGDKIIYLRTVVETAIRTCPTVQNVIVFNTTPEIEQVFTQDETLSHHVCYYDYVDLVSKQRGYCPCEWLDSEDILFVLYTSGSTGKPKGMVHTIGGYLVYASATHKYIFDVRDDDVYACVADVGWITGHTYIIWGPLVNGSTTVMFESIPTYPGVDRYWDLVERYKVNIFYTAPTAIRALMKFGDSPVKKHDLSSLRILGSVGEPINPSAWKWYYNVVGNQKCAIVDTYWMTESGGILMTPLPGVTVMKPGSCTFPFFGIKPVLVNPQTCSPLTNNSVRGVLCVDRPWPGMARTIRGDHKRFVDTYFRPFAGHFFTSDGAYRDNDGYYWIIGRVDDVVNVSGHRLGTAELESALVSHMACSEAAIVGVPHDIKGQAIYAFCILKQGYDNHSVLTGEFSSTIRQQIGGIAIPEKIYIVPSLPKTRSGKIMRRILRKICTNEVDSIGDTSTLADPLVVEEIINIVRQENSKN